MGIADAVPALCTFQHSRLV